MAHWAMIDDANIVVRVVVMGDDDLAAYDFLAQHVGGKWVKTSYNSRGGKRIDPNTGDVNPSGVHFRYNYASAGYTYDEHRDAFIPPMPTVGTWILDEESCTWVQFDA